MLPIVYFRFGSSEIDAPGRDELAGLAVQVATQHGELSVIQVTGHSDRTGTADARRRIGLRRARAVGDFLQAMGVPRHLLRLQGAADSNPMVETDEGVREPQNRRAEIALRFTPEAVAAMARRREAAAAAGRPPPLC